MNIPQEWTFKSSEVSLNFDNHVREQLPFYDLMTDFVCHIIRHYIPCDGVLYDIGAASGNITKRISDTIKTRNISTFSIDNSEHMKSVFSGYGELLICDAVDFDYKNFDVACLFLVMMFLSKEKRAFLIDKLKSKMNIGGVIIIADKIEHESGYIGNILNRFSLSMKLENGINSDDILKKELSLIGVQRPLSRSEIEGDILFKIGDFIVFCIEKK